MTNPVINKPVENQSPIVNTSKETKATTTNGFLVDNYLTPVLSFLGWKVGRTWAGWIQSWIEPLKGNWPTEFKRGFTIRDIQKGYADFTALSTVISTKLKTVLESGKSNNPSINAFAETGTIPSYMNDSLFDFFSSEENRLEKEKNKTTFLQDLEACFTAGISESPTTQPSQIKEVGFFDTLMDYYKDRQKERVRIKTEAKALYPCAKEAKDAEKTLKQTFDSLCNGWSNSQLFRWAPFATSQKSIEDAKQAWLSQKTRAEFLRSEYDSLAKQHNEMLEKLDLQKDVIISILKENFEKLSPEKQSLLKPALEKIEAVKEEQLDHICNTLQIQSLQELLQEERSNYKTALVNIPLEGVYRDAEEFEESQKRIETILSKLTEVEEKEAQNKEEEARVEKELVDSLFAAVEIASKEIALLQLAELQKLSPEQQLEKLVLRESLWVN